MLIVESSVDARPEDFIEQVAGVLEGVGAVGGQTVSDHMDLPSPKVARDQMRDRARHTAVSSWVFGMARGDCAS